MIVFSASVYSWRRPVEASFDGISNLVITSEEKDALHF